MTTRQAISRSGVMLAMVGITLGLCTLFPNAAENSEAGMVMRLPGQDEVAGHIGFKLEISKEEEVWLPADTGLLKMIYYPKNFRETTHEEAREDSLLASLILSGNDRRSLHRPEVCLKAQGWRIADREPVKLEIGGHKLEVMDLWLRRQDPLPDGTVKARRAHYVYWWIGADTSTSSDFQRILITVLDNMFRNVNNRWGYPSVMAYVDLEGADTPEKIAEAEEVARERIFDFIRNFAPKFQKSLGAEDLE